MVGTNHMKGWPVVAKCSQDARLVVEADSVCIDGLVKVAPLGDEECKFKVAITFKKDSAADLLADARELVSKLKKDRAVTIYFDYTVQNNGQMYHLIAGEGFLSVEESVVYRATLEAKQPKEGTGHL